jgi:hypothetical protein
VNTESKKSKRRPSDEVALKGEKTEVRLFTGISKTKSKYYTMKD